MDEGIKNKMPDFIADYIFGEPLADRYGKIFADLKIDEAKLLNKLIWGVHNRKISLRNFLEEAKKFNLPGFNEKIFFGILRYDFFPLADYLGIEINEWLKYLPQPVLKNLKVVNLAAWAKEYLARQEWDFSEEESGRLKKILAFFLKGEGEEKVKKFLARPEKLGGIEMEEEVAEDILSALRKKFQETLEKDEIFTSQEVVFPSPVAGAEPINQPEIVKKEQKLPRPASVVSPQPAPFPAASVFTPPINLYNQKAEEVIKKSGIMVKAELKGRLKLIIISRLKEVRKASETEERLTAEEARGGLGFKKEEAEKIIRLVESARATPASPPLSASRPAPSVPAPFVAPIAAAVPAPSVPAPAQAAPAIFKPAPSFQAQPKPAPPRPSQPSSQPLPRPPAPSQPRPSPPKPSPKIFPSGPLSTSDIKPRPPQDLKIVEKDGAPPKAEPAKIISIPKPAPVNAIPEALSGRPKVEDVSFKPRLVSPVDELREMNLIDFRRLSPKPRVAADKIITKVELLAGEGYEKKVKGIQAWQKSALNQLYAALLAESLRQAKPVKEMIVDWQKQGRECPTFEEFKAIMDLNGELKF
ncbi:MAG: hypothetical protein HY982_02255 [Candidatus Magasanikbacteria bacterium]|nr:hypothetical protein [Candidatus Magasanikbacteria bacterium]